MKGHDLKILRLLHGVTTQAEVAKLLGVSERTISGLEGKDNKLLPSSLMLEVEANFNVRLYEEIKHQFVNIGTEGR